MSKINKVIYGGEILIDLTSDTVTADKLLNGYIAHDRSGETITGTCLFDSNTSDATATADEILSNEVAYANGNRIVGTMKNNGAITGTISTKAGVYTVPQGYHDGSGKVGISANEQAKLIPDNIRQGVTILGITGTMSGTEGAKAQSKEVTPSIVAQTIIPDSNQGYNYLSQVTVKAIPYNETANNFGITVSIG